MASIGKNNIFVPTDEVGMVRGTDEGYATFASLSAEINASITKTSVQSTDMTVTIVNVGTAENPIYDISHPVSSPVTSVNSETGDVVLTADEISGVTAGTNISSGDIDTALTDLDSAVTTLQSNSHDGPSVLTFNTATGEGSHTDFTGGTTTFFNTVGSELDNEINLSTNGGSYLTDVDIANAILNNSTLLESLALALIDPDSTNSLKLGPNNLIFENDAV